jgi:hypothetical protein
VRRVADGCTIGSGDGVTLTVCVVHIIVACFVVIPKAIDLTAIVLKKILHGIIFVIFGRFFGDGLPVSGAG